MRRLFLIAVSGALMVALAAAAGFAQQNRAQLFFQVVTEGEVPQDTVFFGLWGPPGSEFSSVQLTDLDGDGTYTAAAAGIGGPPSTGEYVVRIDQGTTGETPINGGTDTIYGPETITLTEDRTIATRVDFGSDGGPETPDETFLGTAASEVLFGTNANDLIEGLGGSDYLNGLYGNDVLYGAAEGKPSAGDDLIVGEAGSDTVIGGPGNDYLVAAYGYWQQAPDVPASNDFIAGGEGNDLIDAADLAGAPDTVECGPGGDLVYAGVEDNVTDDREVVYRYFGF